jgi:hypothetical protein
MRPAIVIMRFTTCRQQRVGRFHSQHFFVNVDDQQVLKLERAMKVSITIPNNFSKITWGLEGEPHRFADFIYPDANVAGYTTVRPSSQINIYGNWRIWNGFLFWP